MEKRGLTVQKEMPKSGVWKDPKTGYEYFVHFPGADKGFRGNPGMDWLDGLDLNKYPDLNKKSYAEQRGPASTTSDTVEKALGIRKGPPMDYREAAEKANPNFHVDTAYLPEFYIVSACFTAMALWRHKANIKRLLTGTENKFGMKKNQEE